MLHGTLSLFAGSVLRLVMPVMKNAGAVLSTII
jgi:hypothetical protein